LVIDTSSSDPAGTRELGAELAARGLQLLDAPVSMPEPDGVATGRITIMVGGDDEEALDRAEPILASMCTWLFRTGPLGTGHAMKTVNNFIAASSLIATLDGLVMGHKAGLDPATMIEVLNVSTGRNFNTAHSVPEDGLSRRYATGFQLALLVKDLGIAIDLGRHVGFESEMALLMRRQLSEALSALAPNADHSEAIRHWEARADVELPSVTPA
jgi:3-hydroxyisobutyrate dehydrogenase-like beta-hydroxyacid dehydrogenase